MFELSQSKNQIIIKRNTTFLGIGVVAIIMAIAGVRLLFGLWTLATAVAFPQKSESIYARSATLFTQKQGEPKRNHTIWCGFFFWIPTNESWFSPVALPTERAKEVAASLRAAGHRKPRTVC